MTDSVQAESAQHLLLVTPTHQFMFVNRVQLSPQAKSHLQYDQPVNTQAEPPPSVRFSAALSTRHNMEYYTLSMPVSFSFI